MSSISILDNLKRLGISTENNGTSTGLEFFSSGQNIESFSPVDGNKIASVKTSNAKDYEKVVAKAQKAYKEFRQIPAPKRGDLVRQFGNKLREYKDDLCKLVSYEIVNAILFKKLYIRIKSKKEHIAVLKYDISYLSNREIRDLKTSLGKIVRTNRQARQEDGNTQS